MPRCLNCGSAVRPDRGQIVKLDSGFNLASYTEALTNAEKAAVDLKSSRVIVYRPESEQFVHFDLSVHVRHEHPEFHELIVASVDHNGIITESKWVKEQMGVAA